jgi:RNA polymerase sigma-70 factor (ECF subfamily)
MANDLDIDWTKFVKDDAPRIYRYFSARFSFEAADDLTQEVLIRLVGKVDKGHFNLYKGTLIQYAFGVAHFVAKENRKRKLNLSKEVYQEMFQGEEWESQGPIQDESVIKSEDIKRLRLGISQLSEMEQDILTLLIDKDISLEEISQIVDLPLNTVKSHIHRSKIKLKTYLNS